MAQSRKRWRFLPASTCNIALFYPVARCLLTVSSEGNDGPWSTFDLRVGTPEQYVRVLVSTASPEAIVAFADSGCSKAVFKTVPKNCAVSRGNLFQLNASSSWHDAGTYGINQDGVGLEANLGYSQRAQFGLEQVGIGLRGPSIGNQTVAGIATPEPFYLYACIASLWILRIDSDSWAGEFLASTTNQSISPRWATSQRRLLLLH